MNRPSLTVLSLLLIFFGNSIQIFAQGTAEDYRRASRIGGTYRRALKNDSPAYFWHENNLILKFTTGNEIRFQKIDTSSGKLETIAPDDWTKNPLILTPLSRWDASDNSSNKIDIIFVNKFDQPVRLFWVNGNGGMESYGVVEAQTEKTISTMSGHSWVIDFKRNDIAGIFKAGPMDCTAIIDETSRAKADIPDRAQTAAPQTNAGKLVIRDHNIWLKNPDGKEIQLTTDGTADDRYLRGFHYSPNQDFALAFRETRVTKRQIPLVESSPSDQVQPKIKWITYVKPGDELAQRRPHMIDLKKGKLIPVAETPFADSWSVRFQKWSPDSKQAFVLYNQRGHQKLALRAIDASSGQLKDIVDETVDTFVDYSQKTMLHWLDKHEQILWASERDGWNHLYRINSRTGEVLNQVTQGQWVVRDVEFIDEENEIVWFTAMGVHPNQDPYHRHLARVNFDGSNLKVITSADGNHQWEWSADRKFLIDKWSRVDQPPVWDLLRSSDGQRIHKLWQQDFEPLRDSGYSTPVRFEAPGRDGKTMIYGYIVKPSNFDPTKKYPVIEDIYAGPHDHHVGKSFGLQLRARSIAELGFVVVKIDGMGTNWRSKKFHDVCWQNLADGGFPDRIAWIKAAAEKYAWMDISKVGIFGGSAGGQNAMAALLHHGDFYHVAVADCGCHDNRMDKIWWNEAWMGKVGPHYKENSNVTHAKKLQGDLMLTVGEVDSNVDPASTMQVVNALIAANKDFDLIIAPGRGHGVGEAPYFARRRQDFFVRKLLGVEPRNGE